MKMDKLVEEHCNNSNVDISNCSRSHENETTTHHPEAVMVPLTFATIFAIGIVGNVFLLFHIAYSRKMHTPQNMYVANLAVGDLLMLTIAMPFVSTIYTFNSWPYGEVICKLSEFALTFSTAVIIFTLTGLSIERYFIIAIYKPSKRKRLAILGIFGIWIVSFFLSLPDLISANLLQEDGNYFCLLYPASWGAEYPSTHTILKFLMLFLFPLLVIAPFHLLVAVALLARKTDGTGAEFAHVPLKGQEIKEATKNWSATEELFSKRAAERRKRIAFTVLSLVLAFIGCWLPRHIYLMWFYFDPGEFNYFWHCFKIISFCLMFVNSGVNPVVFYILDIKFRRFVDSRVCRRNASGTDDDSEISPIPGKQTIAMTEITQIQSAARIDMI